MKAFHCGLTACVYKEEGTYRKERWGDGGGVVWG